MDKRYMGGVFTVGNTTCIQFPYDWRGPRYTHFVYSNNTQAEDWMDYGTGAPIAVWKIRKFHNGNPQHILPLSPEAEKAAWEQIRKRERKAFWPKIFRHLLLLTTEKNIQ